MVLLADMIMFNAMIDVHRENVLAEDEEIEKRVQSALRYKEQKKIRDAILQEQRLAELRDGCDYFDIPVFSRDMATNDWEKRFLFDMEIRVRGKNELTERQLESLMNIINRYNDKPTERQVNYLRALGYDDETESLTRGEVSKLIDELKEEKI